MSDNTVSIAISSKAKAALRYRGLDIEAFVLLIARSMAGQPFGDGTDFDVRRLTVNKAAVAFVRNLSERRMLIMTQRETKGKTEQELKTAMRRRKNYDYELSIK